MNRRLLALNLVLAAMIGAAGWQLRKGWLEARAREQALLAQKAAAAPAPLAPVVEPVTPIEAADYVDVAQNMLFSRDRNPDVVIEAEAPKPVPPFPLAHGVMDFGGGATAILSEKAGAPQMSFRAGDKIGPFQIAKLSATEIVLEWEGKTFEKKIEELKPKQEPPPSGERTGPTPTTTNQQEGRRENTTTPDAVVKEAQKPADGGPGVNIMSSTMRACVPGDTAPAGTIQGGWRKVVTQTPFGQSCRWELVGK